MTYRSVEATPEPDRSLLVVAMRGVVFALDRATGELCWENVLDNRERTGTVALAVGYGVVIAASESPGVYCLDYLTGRTRWEQRTPKGGRAIVVIEPDHIVCARSGDVHAYTPDGRLLWQRPLLDYGCAAIGYPGNVMQADATD